MFRHCLWAFVAALALVVAPSPAAAQTPTPVVDPADQLFDDTVLQEIRLTINPKDWKTLQTRYLLNDYYTCDFKWRDQKVRNIAIRSRGTGSRNPVKPGLRVDFDYNSTDQKFLGLKSITLRNQSQDASNMHERLAMLFFRRMGHIASREAHAKLYVNEVYVGLYTVVESVDKTFLKKQLKEDDGFLFKYDYNADDQPYYLDYLGADPTKYVKHPFKPETHEDDPQPERVVELIRIINQDPDTIFRKTIEPYLDLERFVKHIAIEMFLADNDGFNGNYGTNNFYIYRFEKKNLFQLIPWDKSNAFMDGPEYPIWHNIYDQPENRRNKLTLRALGFDDLKNLFLETLLECANSASALIEATAEDPNPTDTRGWLEREIDREYEQIRVWASVSPEDRQVFSKEQFEKGIEDLKLFARQRGDFVRAKVAEARGQQ